MAPFIPERQILHSDSNVRVKGGVMQIGKLAELTGVSIRMLRYYENAGLLHPTRTETGYRDFAVHDADVVRRILMLKRAGFTLPVIASVLNCVRAGARPCDALKMKIREQLALIDRQVDALGQSRELLKGLLAVPHQ